MDLAQEKGSSVVTSVGPELYRTLFRCAADSLLLLDHATGTILDANAAAGLMTGRTPDALRGIRLTDLGGAEDPPRVEKVLKEAREKGSGSLDLSLTCPGPTGSRAVSMHLESLPGGILVLLHDAGEKSLMVELIRREREMSRGLLDALNACVLGTEPDGKANLLNPCFRALAGVRTEEVLGQNAIDTLIIERDRTAARRALAGLLDGRSVEGLELTTLSGRTLSLNGAVVRDVGGRPSGTVWVGFDVTGSRRLVERARRGEERTQRNLQQLKAFSRVSSMILQENDLDRVCRMFVEAIRDVSTFNRAILTLCDDEFRGYQWYFAGLNEEQIAEFHQNKLTNRERVTIFQERYRLGNSYYIPHDEGWHYEGVRSNRPSQEMVDWHPDDFLFIPLFGSNGKIVGIVSVDDPADGRRPTAENISPLELFANQVAHAIEEKKLDQQVKKTTKRYRTLVETMNDGLFTVDLGEKITFVNPALAELTGYEEAELIGRDLSFLMSRDSLEEFRRRTRLHLGGAVSRFEMSLQAGRGEEIPVLVSASPYMQDKALIGSFAIVSDLREQKKAEEERERMHEEVLAANVKLRDSMDRLKATHEQLMQAEKLSALGELISGVTHELNNPLTGVMGYSQLLMDSEASPEVKKNLERIHKEAVRCQKIVHNLLAYARRHTPERMPVNVNDVIRSTLDLREYQLKVDNVEVSLDLQSDLPPVLADSYQLQQVFVNIVNNAHHAMLEHSRPGRLAVRSRQKGDVLQVEFKDNGPGIPKDKMTKIFDPFFTTKQIGKGTGLGLSLSYGIVKEHGGEIQVRSEPGAGATFVVNLPVNRKAVEALDKPEEVVTSTQTVEKGRNVLVVDDEETIVELLLALLESSGHRVETARNGREALEKVKKADYDVIISDLKMPDMGGQKLYESVSQIKPHLMKRMIFSTGDTVNPVTQAFFQETGNHYLTKPFRLEDVDRLMAAVLAGE